MDWVRLEPFALKGKEALIMVDKISFNFLRLFYLVVMRGSAVLKLGDL